jgi:hypothetical protein
VESGLSRFAGDTIHIEKAFTDGSVGKGFLSYRLNDSYNRLQQRYASLDASFDRLAEENKSLKQVAADYDALCRGYGADRVEERVRAIREREAEQKRQRRMQRQRHSIGAR